MGLGGRVLLAVVCATAACEEAGTDEEGPPAPEAVPAEVQLAFDGSCAIAGCHVADVRPAMLSLEAADSASIVERRSTQTSLVLVRVGSLTESYMAHKLLPDDQLPAGAMRVGDRMPDDGIAPDDVDNLNTILTWIAGQGPSTGDSAASAGEDSTGPGTTTGVTSADSGDESTSDSGPSTTNPTASGGPPSGPACSVEEVTEGEVNNSLDKGDSAGQIPLPVGEILEDRCGCHTLTSANLATKFPFLLAPGGTLFLDYGDLTGGNLGTRCEEAIFMTLSMPPGSCPRIPDEDRAVLRKWFDDGMPDGATFVPP